MKDETKTLPGKTGMDWRVVSMVTVLLLIWVVFDVYSALRDGRPFYAGYLHQADNLRDLFHQVAVVAILAIGMTLVIVSGNIDLSVGSGPGMFGAIWAALVINAFHESSRLAIVAVFVDLGLGILVGALQGVLVAYANIPSFIVTLGGLTAFLGVKLYVVKEAIPVNIEWISRMGMSGIAPGLGWSLAAVVAVILCLGTVLKRSALERRGLEQEPAWLSVAKLVGFLLPLFMFVWVMNRTYKVLSSGRPSGGISYAVLIAALLAVLVGFIAGKTRFGRHVYAIGGNREAARYAGISIQLHVVGVFAIMGLLTAIAGILQVADLKGASADLGELKELDAIAACVIGGTSLMGGRGTVFGAVIGALIMHSIRNGMRLCSIDTEIQKMILGALLVAAVGLDQWAQSRTARRA